MSLKPGFTSHLDRRLIEGELQMIVTVITM